MFYWIIRAIFYLPISILYPTKVVGKKNLINQKSIITANHRSNADAIIIGIRLRKKINFLGKSELFKNKLSAWFFKKMQVIKVERQKADLSAVKTVLTRLNKGATIGIFPGGTRQKEGEEELKAGVIMFSQKSNAPIIPMMFERRPKIFRFNKLIVGQPFNLPLKPEEQTQKEYMQECINLLKQKQQQLLDEQKKEKD